MNINLKATGIELTPAVSSYARKKISSLDKYLPEGKEVLAHVDIGKNSKHHKEGNIYKADVHLSGGGLDIYAVSEAEDIYTAIDKVENEVAHTLLSKKGRREKLMRKGERAVKQIVKGFNFRKRASEEIIEE